MDENKLLDELKDGNRDAFKNLVQQYQNKVINTCFKFVQNKEDAEDVAQEVFIEVYQSISGFREEAKLSTWIYRIAVTKSLDFIRRKKRKKRFSQLHSILGFENQSEEIPAPESSNPHTVIENQERSQILQQAIDSLAENQKIAVTLNKYEGFSYNEIAEIMETSLSAVESLIHRAKKNLLKKLYKYYENY